MGESLGGAVMIDLAAKDGARGLVLANTFSSLADVGQYHYPWLPIKLLRGNSLDSVAKIGDYHGPLVQIHGDADSIIPISLAQQAVCRRQRAQAVRRYLWRRPQRPVGQPSSIGRSTSSSRRSSTQE